MNTLLSLIFIAGMSILWRLGGSVNKKFRRYGAPVLLLIFTMLNGFTWWGCLASAGALCGVTFLPITLIGNDLSKDGQIFWWIPVLGYLHSMTLIPLIISNWLLGGIVILCVGTLYWILVMASHFYDNGLKSWKWFELAFGAVLALGIVLIQPH